MSTRRNILGRVLRRVKKQWEWRNDSADELIPPLRLMFGGTSSVEDFKNVGEGFVGYFLIDRAGLKPDEKVLDVGCGIGQKARVLTKYLNQEGRYDGLDIVPKGIDWCKERYRKYPNFHFQIADVYNTHYNKHGVKASEYKFPYPDAAYDLVFLSSVFTHMLPHDMKHYFSEISRVLKRGGRCVITFFLLNPESEQFIGANLNSIKVPFIHSEGCRIADKDVPEKVIAYDEKLIRGLYDQNDLRISEITYGHWCGRKEELGCLQDVVIAVKG